MAEEKPKFERSKRAGDKEVLSSEALSSPSFDVVAKAEAIMKSDMPEAQKTASLKEIGVDMVDALVEAIPFNVYAAIRQIPTWKHQALLAFPKAKGVFNAAVHQWDEIFKDF